MKKNIKIVRLTTGEDLIGEVQEGSGIVNIKKPYIIYPTSQPKPGEAISLVCLHIYHMQKQTILVLMRNIY